MKTNKIIFLSFCLACLSVVAFAQEEGTVDRTVVVERDFQPVVQPAGKVNITPEVVEPNLKPVSVTYSSFFQPYQTSFEIHPLGYSEVRFSHPNPLNGYLRAAVGHSATQFDFNYSIHNKREASVNLHASHLGQWGRKTLSESTLGMGIDKKFQRTQLYFNVDATNYFFTRYGQYFAYHDSLFEYVPEENMYRYTKMYGDGKFTDQYKNFGKDLQWEVKTAIGIRSLSKQDFQYGIQTGYETFLLGSTGTEHKIATKGFFDAKIQTTHHVGVEMSINNRFYAFSGDIDWVGKDSLNSNHHALKMQPYYAYDGKKFRIHAGVNIDLALNKTGSKICLPSPNVRFEANLTKDWLLLYGGAIGEYQLYSLAEDYALNRYLNPEKALVDALQRTYKPVDAFLGFVIRPTESLKIDINAHYVLTKDDRFYLPEDNGYFSVLNASHQCWKVGANVFYHYKDIVSVTAYGNYNHYIMAEDSLGNKALDYVLYRPIWEAGLRVDAKINSKISVYSENYFAGGRYAKVADNYILLKPAIDLNIGVQYNINKWLACYLQLNNYLHWQTDVFYGYQTQGANFLAGVSYCF